MKVTFAAALIGKVMGVVAAVSARETMVMIGSVIALDGCRARMLSVPSGLWLPVRRTPYENGRGA